MPGAARQFEPQITRTGGVPSSFPFTARCSECHKTDNYEASKPVADEVVARHFNKTGWILGRDRSFDLCPACLRTPRAAQPAYQKREARDRMTTSQSDRSALSAGQRPKKIDDILARHLGRPAALAEEVFGPKDVQHSSSSPWEPAREAASTSGACRRRRLNSVTERFATEPVRVAILKSTASARSSARQPVSARTAAGRQTVVVERRAVRILNR